MLVKCLEQVNKNKGGVNMVRHLARFGFLSCWSCGGDKIIYSYDTESKKYPFLVKCTECGESTLNCKSEFQAKISWNRAYAVFMA